MTFPYTLVDLTHPLNENISTWNGRIGFEKKTVMDYSDQVDDIGFRIQKLTMFAGIGTHMDAPSHCTPNAATIDKFALEHLLAPCVVIDVSNKANAKFSMQADDVLAFEAEYGKIAKGSFVIVYTGWERFWNEPEKYRNDLKFPSVSRKAAELLLQRNIVGLGIDTLSPDRPDDGFGVHQTLLGNGKYMIENVANAKKLPFIGSFTMALPLKVQGGTEASVRLVGLIPVIL